MTRRIRWWGQGLRIAPIGIRPTLGGAWFLLGSAMIGLASVDADINLLMMIFGLCAGAVFVNALHGWRTLPGLTVRRILPEHAVVGQPIVIRYVVTNRRRWARARNIHIEDMVPRRSPIARPEAFLPVVPAGATETVWVPAVATVRGRLAFSTIRVSTRFPFHLFMKWVRHDVPQDVVVFPRLGRIVSEMRPGSRSSDGQGLGSVMGAVRGDDEFYGVREYREGDNPRRIHWRRSARTGQLMVREMARNRTFQLWCVLNTRVRGEDAAETARLDAAISAAATMICDALERGAKIGLVCNGEPFVILPPGSGKAYRPRLLAELAVRGINTDDELANHIQRMTWPARWHCPCVLFGANADEDLRKAARALNRLVGPTTTFVPGTREFDASFDLAVEAPAGGAASARRGKGAASAQAGARDRDARVGMKRLGAMHLGLVLLALLNMVPAVEAEASWGVFSIAVASAVLSCLYYGLTGRSRLPQWIVLLAVLAATVYLIYEMFYPHQEQTVHIIDLSHFIIFLTCCKFFEFETHRDAGLVALIAFLLMVISSFVTASPFFALAVIVDVTFGIAWLISFHTERERLGIESRRRTALAAASALSPLDLPQGAAQEPAAARKRSILGCAVVMASVAGAVFVVAPRGWKGGLFGRMHGLVPASVTGFDDVVELNNNAIAESAATVMRVRFTRGGEAITDEAFEPYMRGLTFDRYYRGRWQRTPTVFPRTLSEVGPDAPGATVDLAGGIAEATLCRQEVWLESLGTGVLFGIYPAVAFASADIGRITIDRRDMALETGSSARKSAHYLVWSADDPPDDLFAIERRWARSPRDGRSAIPRRVREFAGTFVGAGVDSADPDSHESIANAVMEYLRSEAFEYTLQRGGPATRGDPMSDFLFESRRGHCEYFAASMTLLCQALGIRARMVGGYHGGEFNAVGGFHQFRQSDAHSWVEVWLPLRGWTLFDPTPAAVGRRVEDTSILAALGRLVDFIQFKWSTTVVSFDSKNREAMVRGFQQWFDRLTQTRGGAKSIPSMLKVMLWGPELLAAWQRALYWFLLLLVAVFVVLAVRVVVILSLMLREYLPSAPTSARKVSRRSEARFYDRLVLLLENKGHVKAAHATPREFAQRLARAHPDLSALPEIVDWFYEAQYGDKPLGKARWENVKVVLRQLREDPSFGAVI